MSFLEKAYYWANDQKVPLERSDDLVAIDGSKLRAVANSEKALLLAPKAIKQLTKGWMIVRKSDLSHQLLGHLNSRGGIQPVFTFNDTQLVVLPEIRLEVSRPMARRKLHEWLARNSDRIRLLSEEEGMFSLALVSGDGQEALKIANDIKEKFKPEMSQPRFLRAMTRKA